MPTIIFRNAEKIENKISHSANRASFNDFFTAAENYEVYCEQLATKLSSSEKLRLLHIKKENLERLSAAIPVLIINNESDTVKSIKSNLDAIKKSIKAELATTDKAINATKKLTSKPSSTSS